MHTYKYITLHNNLQNSGDDGVDTQRINLHYT